MTETITEKTVTVNPEYLEYLDRQLQSIQRHLTISRRVLKRLQPPSR